jgi:hypothetical protein
MSLHGRISMAGFRAAQFLRCFVLSAHGEFGTHVTLKTTPVAASGLENHKWTAGTAHY